MSSAQIPSITNTSSDVSPLLQGVAALCLEMSLQVQCGILSKYFQFLNNTHDLPTWDVLTQNANQPCIVRKMDLTQDGHSFFLPTARTSVVSSAQIPSITNTSSDVSLLLQGVAALCLEM